MGPTTVFIIVIGFTCLYVFVGFQGFDQRLTWSEARAYCQAIGGELPSFHHGTTDDVLNSLPG